MRDLAKGRRHTTSARGDGKQHGPSQPQKVGTGGTAAGFAGRLLQADDKQRRRGAFRGRRTRYDRVEMSARLLEVENDERRRMALELHDTTMQNLAAALMVAERLRAKVGGISAAPDEEMNELEALINRSLHELKRLARLLHPPLIEQLGLVAALKASIREFERQSGIAVTFSARCDENVQHEPNVENALFYVVEEGLANVRRHSGSLTAEVRLMRSAHLSRIEVIDQGKGMPNGVCAQHFPEASAPGIGLRSMSARLHSLGGELQVRSNELGTSISACVPGERQSKQSRSFHAMVQRLAASDPLFDVARDTREQLNRLQQTIGKIRREAGILRGAANSADRDEVARGDVIRS